MSETSMFFNIFGRDMGVGTMFEEVAGKGTNVTGSLKGIAAAAAGLGIVKMGREAVQTFEDVAGSTKLLQRETGASAEDASRLQFALTQVGLSAEDTKKGFGIFSKHLVESAADGEKHTAMVQKLGFEYLDANGKILPLTEILPRLASRFAEMENGPEKTALALQLFGKSGADMVPFLNKGGDAIHDLMVKSDELGNTLSQDQVNSFMEAKIAGREWDATMRGLGITVGGALLPVMHAMEQVVRGVLTPAIQGLEGWFKSLPGPVQGVVTVLGAVLLIGVPLIAMLGSLAGGIMSLVPVVSAIIGGLSALWTVLMANPIFLVIGIIAAFVASLIYAYNNVGWFRDFVDSAFHLIQDIVSNVVNFITGVLVPLLVMGWNQAGQMAQTAGEVISGAWNVIVGAVSGAVSGVIGFVNSLGSTISSIWSGIVSNTGSMVGSVVGFFAGLPGQILGIFAGAGSWLVDTGANILRGLISGVQSMIGSVTSAVQNAVGSAIDGVKGFLGIHSPSTLVADEVGVPMGQGVAVGVRRTFGSLLETMQDMGRLVAGTDLGIAGATLGVTAGSRGSNGGYGPVYVQNPFTGEYLLAKVDDRAGGIIDSANDDIYRGRAR